MGLRLAKEENLMTPNDRIQKIVAQGKTRFVLVRGVLFFGLSTAALVTVFGLIRTNEVHVSDIMINLFVFCPVSGIIWGLAMWAWFKKRAAQIASETQK